MSATQLAAPGAGGRGRQGGNGRARPALPGPPALQQATAGRAGDLGTGRATSGGADPSEGTVEGALCALTRF